MRYHVLRFDMWLCLLLSVGLAFGAGKIATKIFEDKYEVHKEEQKVDENEIGGKATEETFRAESIEDILSHDTFTVVSPGIEYMNRGSGYYKGMYLHSLILPSGERVAARINSDSVIHEGDSIYTGDSILPVGRVIKEDLTKEKTFINQIEYKEPLDRKDFYIDMVGEAEIMNEEMFIESPVMIIQLVIIIITFPIFHMIGSKLGIFPYIFPPKKLQENEWN
ncbi:MAG: hypothetical protein HFG33_02690 [Bacilli bacterium]|nr:hypothetical protein [Bacilli bacterium]